MFYMNLHIAKSYIKDNGSTSSTIIGKLGTLNQLIKEHEPTRDDVLAWSKNEVKKYKKEKDARNVQITFHAGRALDYSRQIFYRGRYLFLQPDLFRPAVK